ncbi:MAG: hypothetical protein E6K91_01725 [Thaumarchaeota archaeon]|nr:MAG: hypothetical protein E6K91_01725 [Nitrososphaerota archaeon]
MDGSDGESKNDSEDSIIDINEKISRTDFLKKLVAGGVITVVGLSGLGGMKVFAEKDPHSNSGHGSHNNIAGIIQQVNQLRKQLGDLQTQFEGVISGKSVVPEMIVQKLTTSDGVFIKLSIPDTGFMKINGDSTFYKLTVPENGFMKIDGDSAFLKLTVPENGFMKIDGDSAFLKLTVPENGFMKIDGDSAFLKLTVPENGFMKIDGDASFIKIDAAEIVAQKIVAKSITTEEPTIG